MIQCLNCHHCNLRLNYYHHMLIITIIVLNPILCLINAQSLPQRYAIEPSDKTAIVGDTVIFPCRVINKVGTLQWTRDGFGLGTDRQLSGFPRYTMIGNDEEGDYSLQIANVQLEDDAIFQCQVGAMDGVKGIRSRNSAFTVFVPPDVPTIVQSRAVGDVLKTTAGMSIELTCEATGGKPPAELTFFDGDSRVTTGTQYTTQKQSDSKRYNAYLKWKFTASREYNGRKLTCRSENAALKKPQKTFIHIEVKYAPEVKLTIASRRSDEPILVDDDVHFRCNATANPNQLIYKWYKNDEIIVGDYTTRLTIHKVTKDMNGATIACEVSNSVGTSRAKHVLKVHYAPTFKSPVEQVIGADLRSDATLSCLVEGNPSPEITWLHHGSPNVLNTGSYLTVRNVSADNIGKYICRASVKGFPEIQATVLLYIKGPPRIKGPYVQYGIEGEAVTVSCVIGSVPLPSRILWQRNSLSVDVDNNEGYEIIEEPLSGESTIRSMIVIHKSKADDFGQYNCSVWNQFGSDSRIITLIQETALSSLLFTVGIIICCIFMVVTVTIVAILCIKRKTPSDSDSIYHSDLKKGNDSMTTSSLKNHHVMDSGSSGADSDIKAEIRTASSLSQQWNDIGGHSDIIDANAIANDISHVVENIYSYTNNINYNIPSNNKNLIANNNGYASGMDYNNRVYIPSQTSPHHNHASIIVPSEDEHQYRNSFMDPSYGSIIDSRYSRASHANAYARSSMASNSQSVPLSSSGQFYALSGQQHVEVKQIGSNHSLATHV